MLSKTVPTVVFQCDVETHPLICDALTSALRARMPSHNLVIAVGNDAPETPEMSQTAALTIRYVEEKRSTDWLLGHLVWQVQNKQPVTGPALELSVMDSNLARASLAPFAQALIEVSEIPALQSAD